MSRGGRQERVLVSHRAPKSPASALGVTPSMQSQPISRKPKSGPRLLFPFSSVCSHCLGGVGGLLSLPRAGKIPPLMPSACVRALERMSGNISPSPIFQRMSPTPPSISGLRVSVSVMARLPVA